MISVDIFLVAVYSSTKSETCLVFIFPFFFDCACGILDASILPYAIRSTWRELGCRVCINSTENCEVSPP